MNNWLYTKLMFPEPDASGGGNEAPEAEDENPFGNISFEEADNAEVPENEEPENEEQEEEEYSLSLEDGLDIEPEEVTIFTEAAKEHGIKADVASKMFNSLIRKVNENGTRVQKEVEQKAVADLRAKWGKDFAKNTQMATQMIATVGKRCGWTPEMMNNFKNATAMSVFYDVARATNGRLSIGVTKASAAPVKKSPEEIRKEQMRITSDFLDARRAGNWEEARKLSDMHMELAYQLTGKKGARILNV